MMFETRREPMHRAASSSFEESKRARVTHMRELSDFLYLGV